MGAAAAAGGEERDVVGNGKQVRLACNSGVLRVVGNGNRVTVARNDGRIFLTGNRGKLQITHNTGYVCYTGNDGIVEIGTTSQAIGQVIYIGNGGKVTRLKPGAVSKDPPVKRNSKKSTPTSTTDNKAKEVKRELLNELKINGIDINPTNTAYKKSYERNSCFCGQEAKSRSSTRIKLKHVNNVRLEVPDLDLGNWGLRLGTELLVM